MSKIAVVYWSGTGNTEAMAQAIESGAASTGADVTLFPCSDFSDSDVANYDALAFGCSASGSEVLEENEFEPLWDAAKSSLSDKKVVLFGSYGWGGGEFMNAWKTDCEESGISLVGTITCQDAPDDGVQEECKALGVSLSN